MIDYFEPPERFNLSHYLIDRHIESDKGDRIALVCPEGEWTYEQLYQQANRFAHLLIERGARPEERILIGIRDSVDFVAALLGTLKAGCVVVMISPDLKPEQVAEMISYSRARVAVVERGGVELFHQAFHLITDTTQRHLQLLIEMLGGERTHILEGEEEKRAHPPAQERVPTQEKAVTEKGELSKICFQEHILNLSSDHLTMTTHRDDPAVWLFSGGTTGRPKAIVQPHRSFVYTTEHYGRGVMGYTEDDRTISIPKLYFGYATGANLFFPLSVGASCILFPDRPTPPLLFELIQRHRPTLLINVPTLINRMVHHPDAQASDLSSLRAVTSAGEALPISLHEAWEDCFGSPLYDGLGTAEMWHIFLTNSPTSTRRGSLGKVVDGFEISLKNTRGEPVSQGEIGVMWVKGGARALYYWRQLDATWRAFRGEWYVSGDLLKQDDEGFYYYCGRQDDMIKVAGKWVSPKEVEDQLMRHPQVKECAVVGKHDQIGLLKAYAYIVPNEPFVLEREGERLRLSLIDHLTQKLDRYKLPKEITILSKFQRTHLGKIDRGALKS